MKKIMLMIAIMAFFDVGLASAFEYTNVERNDPLCDKSMKLVKRKFGNPDSINQLTPNSITIIYRSKRLHFTFEVVGRNCVVTSSDF